jgi:hypothetical protein
MSTFLKVRFKHFKVIPSVTSARAVGTQEPIPFHSVEGILAYTQIVCRLTRIQQSSLFTNIHIREILIFRKIESAISPFSSRRLVADLMPSG